MVVATVASVAKANSSVEGTDDVLKNTDEIISVFKRTRKYTEEEIEIIIKQLKGDGFKNNPLRIAYEHEVRDLSKMADDLLKQGIPEEEVARMVYDARRNLGIKYKDATPQPLRDYIYEINKARYDGDPLGPSFESMLDNKTYQEIIESSSRANSDIDKLLSGFEEWLRRQ